MIETIKSIHPSRHQLDYNSLPTVAEVVDESVEQYPAPDQRTPDQILEITDSIQSAVRNSLRYDPQAFLEDVDSDDQLATCAGYTLVGSEALERAEVPHYVAMMNEHSNIFVPFGSDNGRRVWMADMLCSDLSQDVTDIFALYKTDGATNRSYGTLVTSKLDTGPYDQHSVVGQYPWVALKEYPDPKLEAPGNRRLIVTLSEQEVGRASLMKYTTFRDSMRIHDEDAATQAILDLHGEFPDIDIRGDSVKGVKGLVKNLARQGEVDRARDVTAAFFDSFVGEDSRVYEYRADCEALVANISGSSEFAHRAVKLYEKALAKRKIDKSSVVGKLACSRQLLEATR